MAKIDIESFLDREELRLASVGKRALAHGIDSILLLLILVAIDFDTFLTMSQSGDPDVFTQWAEQLILFYLPLALIYQILFVTMYGATLGKMVMKIYIIDVKTGATPRLDVAINRSLFRLVSEVVYNLGFLWGVFDPFKQTWHDKTASTLVIDA